MYKLDQRQFIVQSLSGAEEIRSWQYNFEYLPNVRQISPVPLSNSQDSFPPGLYAVSWVSGNDAKRVHLAVVDRSIVIKQALNEVLVWVTDIGSGEPPGQIEAVAGAPAIVDDQATRDNHDDPVQGDAEDHDKAGVAGAAQGAGKGDVAGVGQAKNSDEGKQALGHGRHGSEIGRVGLGGEGQQEPLGSKPIARRQ